MKRRRHTPEQIIRKLREAERLCHLGPSEPSASPLGLSKLADDLAHTTHFPLLRRTFPCSADGTGRPLMNAPG